MTAEELIRLWAVPKFQVKPGQKIEIEMKNVGDNCPTCGYDEFALIVSVDYKEVAQYSSFSALMNEVLAAGGL